MILLHDEVNKMKEVHLVCNAHIDPIWQWDWQEGVSAVLSTFQSAVNIAEEYDYVFCHNEVTVYKYVEAQFFVPSYISRYPHTRGLRISFNPSA